MGRSCDEGTTGIPLVDAFELALGQNPKDLQEFAASVYPNDLASQTRLIGMVQHHEAAQSAIQTAGGEQQNTAVPERIGEYDIAGIIGEGGMGIVYLGHRKSDELQQNVAIKVDGSTVGSIEAQRRFLSERAILAALDHPFIAQLFDWGTTEDGRSFQVMEFIDGIPIDEYVNRDNLTVPQIIELVLKLCSAVAGAHRNLVIHRDIKASNVLVTRDGLPKLIDFGIAKQLEDTVQTVADALTFTPAYASPEQLRGDQLTTATDVYSMGVLLYKLITSKLPHALNNLSWQQAQEHVQTTAVEYPRSLSADLRIILSTALQTDVTRRYGTIREFEEDLKNYLSNRPINARPDSLTYQIAKFVKRNAALTIAACIAAIAITGALSVSLWQTQRAQTQLVRAERVTEFLSDLLVSPSPSIEASYQLRPDATLQEILAAAEEELSADDSIPWDIRVELLNSISHSHMWMEQESEAIAAQSKSLAIATAHKHDNQEAFEIYLHTLAFMAETHENDLNFARSIELYQQVDAEAAERGVTENIEWLNVLNNYAFTLARANRWPDAYKIQSRQINNLDAIFGSDPNPSRVVYFKNMAQILIELGEMKEAKTYIEKALLEYEGTDQQDPFSLYKTRRILAWHAYLEGNLAEAARHYDSINEIKGLTYSYAFADQALARAQAARIRIALADDIDQQISIIHAIGKEITEYLKYPDAFPYYLALASAYHADGNNIESLTMAQRALENARQAGATTSEIKDINNYLDVFRNQANAPTQ